MQLYKMEVEKYLEIERLFSQNKMLSRFYQLNHLASIDKKKIINKSIII